MPLDSLPEFYPAGPQYHAPMTPADWIDRCTARLRELVQDEGVRPADLRRVAEDMAADPAYRDLAPEAAAEKQQRDEA